MKLASIVPVNNIIHTFDGQYAMLLTHLRDYYPKCNNKNCYIIMDNSLIELGGAVDVMTVYKAAKECGAHEFILPDVYRDGIKTLELVKKSIEELRNYGYLHDMKLMAVCQGKTAAEFTYCFEQLEKIPEIHCIGIPKVSAELSPKGRPGLESLWQGSPKAIHLLGCWSSLREFMEYKNPAAIRSCDTCIPALLSINNIDDPWQKRPEKTIDLIHDKIKYDAYNKIVEQLMEEDLL